MKNYKNEMRKIRGRSSYLPLSSSSPNERDRRRSLESKERSKFWRRSEFWRVIENLGYAGVFGNPKDRGFEILGILEPRISHKRAKNF